MSYYSRAAGNVLGGVTPGGAFQCVLFLVFCFGDERTMRDRRVVIAGRYCPIAAYDFALFFF